MAIKKEEDFQKFLAILARYKDKFGFRNYHFCLMPTHIHFLWEISRAETLSKAMQGIALSYTRYHHAKYKSVGYLWQGRFKHMLVDKENYLMLCGAYIERNPKRAGLVQEIEEWPWSSYRFYAFGEEMKIPIRDLQGRKKVISIIDFDPYCKFGETEKEQQSHYQEFVLSFDDAENREKLALQDGGVIGSNKF